MRAQPGGDDGRLVCGLVDEVLAGGKLGLG